MKNKNLVPLLASILLALVLVVMGCAQTITPTPTSTATKTPSQPVASNVPPPAPVTVTQTVKETFNALDPTGIFVPVQTKALAARLDTLDGKTIYVCQGEADPVIMPALYKALVDKFTKTTFIYYDRSDFGPSTPGTGAVATSTGKPEDPDILKKVQGVVRGNGW